MYSYTQSDLLNDVLTSFSTHQDAPTADASGYEIMSAFINNIQDEITKSQQTISKQRAWMSATEFGAMGDGQSHPLSSIFSTLAEAQATYPDAVSLADELDYCALMKALKKQRDNGRRIFLPKQGSNYVTHKAMTVNFPIDMFGENVRIHNTGNDDVLQIIGTSSSRVGGSKIERIAFDGSPTTTPDKGLRLEYVDSAQLLNIGGAYTSLFYNHGSQPLLRDIGFWHSTGKGIYLGDIIDPHMLSLWILASVSDGLYMENCSGLIASQILSLSCAGRGIYMEQNNASGQWNFISDSLSDTSGGDTWSIKNQQGLDLSNCWGASSQNAGTNGMTIDSSKYITVNGGHIRNNKQHGILIKGTCQDIVLNTPKTLSNGGNGIAIQGTSSIAECSDITINAHSTRNTGYGISANAYVDGLIYGGNFRGNTAGGTSIDVGVTNKATNAVLV